MEIIHYSNAFRSTIDRIEAVRGKIAHVHMEDIMLALGR